MEMEKKYRKTHSELHTLKSKVPDLNMLGVQCKKSLLFGITFLF